MNEYRDSKKFSFAGMISNTGDNEYSVLKILCITVLIKIIGFFSYPIFDRSKQADNIAVDRIVTTENDSRSFDLMEILEKHPLIILIGIFVGSFVVFYMFFKGFSSGGGSGGYRGGGYGGSLRYKLCCRLWQRLRRWIELPNIPILPVPIDGLSKRLSYGHKLYSQFTGSFLIRCACALAHCIYGIDCKFWRNAGNPCF